MVLGHATIDINVFACQRAAPCLQHFNRELVKADEGNASLILEASAWVNVPVKPILISAAKLATNKDVPMTYGDRRPGDATALVSGSERAMSELGWTPTRSNMAQMIGDAWRWHQDGGYPDEANAKT